MRNTRTRAATAAILATIGCMAMDDQAGNRAGHDLPADDPAPSGSVDRGDLEDAAADRAVSRMRERVREEERALRASLDASEAGRDWAELLERKHSTDGWLMPLVGKYAWNWGWPAAYRTSPRLRFTGSR